MMWYAFRRRTHHHAKLRRAGTAFHGFDRARAALLAIGHRTALAAWSSLAGHRLWANDRRLLRHLCTRAKAAVEHAQFLGNDEQQRRR